MKGLVKITGKLILALLCIVFIFLLTTTIYHHVSLGNEVNAIRPNGILVDLSLIHI